jgi:hypothetical protein
MTYEESSALMQSIPFRGRIKVAGLKYADSIMIEATSVPAHNTRMRWAQATAQSPDQAASQLQPLVTMDAAVQAAGIDPDGDSQITDAALQVTVETTVNKML